MTNTEKIIIKEIELYSNAKAAISSAKHDKTNLASVEPRSFLFGGRRRSVQTNLAARPTKRRSSRRGERAGRSPTTTTTTPQIIIASNISSNCVHNFLRPESFVERGPPSRDCSRKQQHFVQVVSLLFFSSTLFVLLSFGRLARLRAIMSRFRVHDVNYIRRARRSLTKERAPERGTHTHADERQHRRTNDAHGGRNETQICDDRLTEMDGNFRMGWPGGADRRNRICRTEPQQAQTSNY